MTHIIFPLPKLGFTISFRAGVLLIISLGFISLKKSLFALHFFFFFFFFRFCMCFSVCLFFFSCSSFLKHNFAGYGILGWQSSFISLNISFYSILAHLDSDEKSMVILIHIHLWVRCIIFFLLTPRFFLSWFSVV